MQGEPHVTGAELVRACPGHPKKAKRKAGAMGIISWLVLGTIVGFLVNWLAPGRFPGGVLGTVVGGTAGAFLGGAIFSLLADRGVAGFDALSLLIALAGAALLLAVARRAAYAEPRAH
jgi:uncharacterized membrane protein YeaQ/YmgE (transglycosylase-associated protein family)